MFSKLLEANGSSASQQMFFYDASRFYYRVQKSPPLLPVQSQMTSIQTLHSTSFILILILFSTLFLAVFQVLSSRFSGNIFVCIYHPCHACCMFCQYQLLDLTYLIPVGEFHEIAIRPEACFLQQTTRQLGN